MYLVIKYHIQLNFNFLNIIIKKLQDYKLNSCVSDASENTFCVPLQITPWREKRGQPDGAVSLRRHAQIIN